MADAAALTQEQKLALARARTATARARLAAQTSLAEQVGTGTSEGIANMAGLPVDAMTGALNWLGGKVGMDPIEEPFGGSESIRGLLDPFMSDIGPQTAGQRIGRRVGQDVGAGAVAAPLAGISSMAGVGQSIAADAASGLAGGATAEVTDNPAINAIISTLAGTGVAAGPYMARPGPQAPSNAELSDLERALWQRVQDSSVRLTPRASQELKGDVSARAIDMKMKPSLHGPEATAAIDEVWDLPDRPSLYEIEEARRFIGDNYPVSPDRKSTGRIMSGTRGAIDEFVDRIPHPDAGIAKEAREVSRRRIASEKLDKSIDKAERRAAASGSGGNQINTSRQNINRLLDSPKDANSFTKGEREVMEAIVRGDGATNTARMIGGMSPERGALPLMGGMIGAGAAGTGFATGNPAAATAALAPSVIGFIAKRLGENLTERQIQNLSQTIRNGGVPVGSKAMTEGEQRVLAAFLASQLPDGAEQ